MRPKISVIIPAFNEEKYIANVLEGLRGQIFKDFETIVVDKNSSDNTKKIARRQSTVIIEPRKGIGLARNTGARHARGELFFFTNADTDPSSGVLRTYREAFSRNPNLVAATGPMEPLEKTGWFTKFGYWFASVFLAKLSFLLGIPAMSGSNLMVRRSAFKKIHGFDESLETSEDIDLVRRLHEVG